MNYIATCKIKHNLELIPEGHSLICTRRDDIPRGKRSLSPEDKQRQTSIGFKGTDFPLIFFSNFLPISELPLQFITLILYYWWTSPI